jgi:hypothetical protein
MIKRKIFNVHSIRTLFENFLIILENNRDSIYSRTGCNWFDIPEEIPILINKLEEYDSNSTMFRYPISMDKNLDYQKSTFKNVILLKEKLQKSRKVNQNLRFSYLFIMGTMKSSNHT